MAFASTAAPTWVMTCSVKLPSVAANVFHSRWAAYVDSVNANFYRDHAIRAFVEQLYVPFAVVVQPEFRLREYTGINIMGAPPTRDDVIFSVIGGIHYNFRNWIAATVDYKFSTVQTDFSYMVNGETIDLNFVRHELLLGMRVAM